MIRDPDASIVALFKHTAVKNDAKSADAGRPIYDDREVCELRYPGSRNVGVYPATAFSHWGTDPDTGEQMKITYAERFHRQYQQFKAQATQTKSGTPLMYAAFLTEARKAELRAQNLYTVEALAEIDGIELKNLGMGGRELKNKALEYLEGAKLASVDTKLAAEIEALRARNAILEEDAKTLKERRDAEGEFAEMSIEQLRDFVKTNSGQEPIAAATMNRKTLLRLAQNLAEKAPA